VNDAKDKTISEQILNAENSVREQERSVVSVADGMLPDPSWKSESVGAVKKTRRPIKALLSGTSDLVFEDKTLDDVLASKRNEGVGASVVSVGEGDTVFSAINLMDKQGIGAVLVRNARGDFVGIFTERDYVHKIALQGLPSHSTPVKRAMLTKLTFLSTKDTVTKCMQTMNDGKLRVRHVLVRDANTNLVVGMISVGDILRTIIRAYKETASHMRDFVGGKYTH
jgi:CBS domain-containing protein